MKMIRQRFGALLILGILIFPPVTRAAGPDASLLQTPGTGSACALTYSPEDLQQLIPQLANDAAGLGQGLADAIADVIASQGNPSGLIVGTELQGALFVGYRKGVGKVLFKGQPLSDARTISWSAPSIGTDVGGSVGRAAILVYGARDMSSLMRQFISIEGTFHMVAGASISYMQSMDDPGPGSSPQLAYISVGLGMDAGVAVETLSFSPSG